MKLSALPSHLVLPLLNFKWDGKFPKKRNWFLQNHALQTKWVLFLDADEYLTDAFKQEVTSALATTDKVGYLVNLYQAFFR